MRLHLRLITACLLALVAIARSEGREAGGKCLLDRMFDYAASVDTVSLPDSCSYAYMKYVIRTDRRNVLLMAVPTMYAVAHGGARAYVGEVYNRVMWHGGQDFEAEKLLSQTTIPHRRKAMPTLLKYLTPRVYDVTLIDDNLLSPFHRSNRMFYRYRETVMYGGVTRVAFRPKRGNTQLVRGSAMVDSQTGRVISMEINGEYDMVRFRLVVTMCREQGMTLLPSACDLHAEFKFLGNKTSTDYLARYNLSQVLSKEPGAEGEGVKGDSLLMARVRPVPLTAQEQDLYHRHYARKAANDTTTRQQKRENKASKVWSSIGESLINRTRSNFGPNDQGYFRVSPILNPLYFGYSKRKGYYYKFDVRGSYQFDDNRELSARFKASYSFKLKQFYFKFPVNFFYNKARGSRLLMEIGGGDRTWNSAVAENMQAQYADQLDGKTYQFDYFRNFYMELSDVHQFSDYFATKCGLVFRRRSAIDKAGFRQVGEPHVYKSAAPLLELRYRPLGMKGPVVTLDYERSFKGFLKSNTGYERWELDGQYIYRMPRLQALSMRAGLGFYTQKDRDAFFLDYSNFRENTLSGGWNDDWSGEFELLNRNWYNSSNYYLRGNLTYESPLLLLSWLPIVGRFMETERLYMSVLSVTHLHPYVECGYGFTTRLFSIGVFAANMNGKFDGVGCKLGFELFRDW